MKRAKIKLPKTTRTSAIGVIVARARSLNQKAGRDDFDSDWACSRLVSYHVTHPLRLTALAKADDFNLAHDCFGILSGRDFVPRFAIRQ